MTSGMNKMQLAQHHQHKLNLKNFVKVEFMAEVYRLSGVMIVIQQRNKISEVQATSRNCVIWH